MGPTKVDFTRDKFSDHHLDTDQNADKISMITNQPLEETVVGLHIESSETNQEKVLCDPLEQDSTQIPPDKSAPVDVPKALTLRDYMKALSIFFIVVLTYGNQNSIPILTIEWLQEFKDSKSLVLYVSSLFSALISAVGVIDGYLINRFGIYRIIILGCFMQNACLIGSAFSTNAITLVIVLGFSLGVASCFCYLNCFILMGLEFGDKGKYFIAGLSLAGPLAGFIFPNLVPIFVEEYTWRGGMFIMAGINLQMVPFALFLLLSHGNDKKNNSEETNSIPAPKKYSAISLFKDPLFVAYLCSVTFTMSGILGIGSLFPSFMYKKGFTLKEAAEFYSIYRSISAIPRVLGGIILRLINIRFIYLFIASSTIFGLISILIHQAVSFTTLLISIVALSLFMGCPAGLYSIGTLECVGQDKYSFASPVVETSYGIGVAVFGYLAGLLVEYMDSFQEVFLIYGGLMIISNICLLLTSLFTIHRERKHHSNSNEH